MNADDPARPPQGSTEESADQTAEVNDRQAWVALRPAHPVRCADADAERQKQPSE